MKYIDINNWPRKKHFEFFKQLDSPHFNLCANVDITDLYSFIKQNKLSFFKTILYIAVRTANNIDGFRQRIRGEQIVEHDSIHPSFTAATDELDLFSFCNVQYTEDFNEFIIRATEKMNEVANNTYIPEKPEEDNLLYLTCIPWVSFTSISHAMHMNPPDSVPRIAWGKSFEENGKLKMPLAVQVHHGLMDGRHVGKYFNDFQELANNPEKFNLS